SHLRSAIDTDAVGHFGLFAREVGADNLPTVSAARRFEQHVAGEIKNVRIDRREDHRRGAKEAILAASSGFGRNVLDLARAPIEARDLAAVNDVWVQRIRRDVSVFFDADRMPFAKGDLAVVASTGDSNRAALLLSAVHAIWKLIVGDDVIELRGWLVIPRAPRLSAVDGDDRALIARNQNYPGVVGIDPDGVIIIAAGRSAKSCPVLTRVSRTPGDYVRAVNNVGALRISLDLGEVASSPPRPRVVAHFAPTFSGVVRAVDSAGLRRSVNRRVHSVRIARRDTKADSPQALLERRKPF